ncbi:hypothetical protein HanPI659440_Chr06g0237651 [Helianthus annuus]|nr:hypothetical protein HanPI659440_Chr06g0237651 [Helianthus annuus]
MTTPYSLIGSLGQRTLTEKATKCYILFHKIKINNNIKSFIIRLNKNQLVDMSFPLNCRLGLS